MHRHFIFAIAVMFGMISADVVIASDDDDRRGGRQAFVGLWQGIDSFDGSTQYLSITCKNRKSCDVRLNDTSFGLSCPGEAQTGFARGRRGQG